MPFNGLLFGLELEGAACQLCQAECLRAAILLHRISTQPTVNNISTEGKIVYFRSIWQNYDTKSLANTSTGPNNKEQNTNKNCYFLPESLCSLLWRRDGWYRLERESFQSAIVTVVAWNPAWSRNPVGETWSSRHNLPVGRTRRDWGVGREKLSVTRSIIRTL